MLNLSSNLRTQQKHLQAKGEIGILSNTYRAKLKKNTNTKARTITRAQIRKIQNHPLSNHQSTKPIERTTIKVETEQRHEEANTNPRINNLVIYLLAVLVINVWAYEWKITLRNVFGRIFSKSWEEQPKKQALVVYAVKMKHMFRYKEVPNEKTKIPLLAEADALMERCLLSYQLPLI